LRRLLKYIRLKRKKYSYNNSGLKNKTVNGDPIEKIPIELLFDEEHAKYLDSLPLHSSQLIESEIVNKKQRVAYKLIPN